MNKNFLPLGSIVKLNNDKRKLMVVAYKSKSQDSKEIYDYAGCLFPEGLMEDYYVLFNKYDVSEVFFEGYKNEELDNYEKKISSMTGNSTGGLSYVSTSNEKDNKKRNLRTPKEPTNPRTASEMMSRYGVKQYSGTPDCEHD